MSHRIRKTVRATFVASALVIGMATASFAGCPPVDLQRCEVLHEETPECERVRAALK